MKTLQAMGLLKRGICFDPLFAFCSSLLQYPVLQSSFQQPFKSIFKQLLGIFYIEVQKKAQGNCCCRMYLGTTKWESWANQPLPGGGPEGRRRAVLAGSFMTWDAMLQHVARSLTSREDPCSNPAVTFPQASSPTYILTEYLSPISSLATRFQLRN